MNKLKNAVFSVLNVLVIAGILLFIMAGLVEIGIFQIPDYVKEFFGIEDSLGENDENESASDFLDSYDDTDKYEVYTAKLDSESVKKILSELKPAKAYYHDVQYSVISQKNILTKRAYIMKNDDAHCAFYLSGDGNVEKQIVNSEGTITVNTLSNGKLQTVSYKGESVDFAAQTGVILTHEEFFDAADEPGYTFEIKSDDIGTVMLIEFTSIDGEYSQLQKYTLSLDFGIVTEAYCYENDMLIYELTTNALSKEPAPNFVIPQIFTDCLPEEFTLFTYTAVKTAEEATEEQE